MEELKPIESKILEKVKKCINDYSLIDKNEEVIVAYSGGKDSLLLCRALNELGYKVVAVIVDIGYNADWTTAIENAEKYAGVSCFVVDINYVEKYLPDALKEAIKYFEQVKEVYSKQGNTTTTICTPCYNAKYAILKALSKKLGIKKIAFGHHGTDAVTSLLKSYFMYQDRWAMHHEKFDLKNIYDLVNSNIEFFCDQDIFDSSVKNKIIDLTKLHKISTDEPPRQTGKDLTIIRPLFYCREEDIISEMNRLSAPKVKSECSYFYRKDLVETSREYIQFHLVNGGIVDKVFDDLIKIIQLSLDKSGELKFNARAHRKEILGDEYKSAVGSEKNYN